MDDVRPCHALPARVGRSRARDRDAEYIVAHLSRARPYRARDGDRPTDRSVRPTSPRRRRSVVRFRARRRSSDDDDDGDGRATSDARWVLRFVAKRRPRSARRSVGVDCLKRARGRRSPRRSEKSRQACGADARRARVDARAMEIIARGAEESLITEARRTEGTGGSECTTRTGRGRLGDSTEARTR